MKTKLIRKPVGWLIALALWMFDISIPAQIIYSNIGQNTFGTQKATDLRTKYPGGAQVVDPLTGETLVKASFNGTPTFNGTISGAVSATITGGSNSVGGYTGVSTNSVTIATNAHTVGMVITSFTLSNFFAVPGGSAWLQTFSWDQFGQTNTDNKIVWFFSRPITGVTNNALWGPTAADMEFKCSAPILLLSTADYVVPFGVSGFSQFATGLQRPMKNTWNNRELYGIVTQNSVGNAAYTSNAVTAARIRVTSSQDITTY